MEETLCLTLKVRASTFTASVISLESIKPLSCLWRDFLRRMTSVTQTYQAAQIWHISVCVASNSWTALIAFLLRHHIIVSPRSGLHTSQLCVFVMLRGFSVSRFVRLIKSPPAFCTSGVIRNALLSFWPPPWMALVTLAGSPGMFVALFPFFSFFNVTYHLDPVSLSLFFFCPPVTGPHFSPICPAL